MYDQFGFYSENGYPGAGGRERRPGAARAGPHWISAASISPISASGRRRGRRARVPDAAPEAGGGFRDIFSQFFGGRGEAAQPKPEKGADLEYVLNIDFWQAIKGTQARVNITRYEVCGTCHGSGSSGGGEVTCPQCKGTGHVTQMAGAMKFNLTCPRCGGSGKLRNACPTCRGDGRVTHTESVEVRIPPGARDGSRLRVPGKGNAGTMGAPAGRSLHHHPRRTAPVLPPRRRQHRDHGSGRGVGGGAGRQDRSARPSTAARC